LLVPTLDLKFNSAYVATANVGVYFSFEPKSSAITLFQDFI
jgi:hypothetical protein